MSNSYFTTPEQETAPRISPEIYNLYAERLNTVRRAAELAGATPEIKEARRLQAERQAGESAYQQLSTEADATPVPNPDEAVTTTIDSVDDAVQALADEARSQSRQIADAQERVRQSLEGVL